MESYIGVNLFPNNVYINKFNLLLREVLTLCHFKTTKWWVTHYEQYRRNRFIML